MAKMTGFKYFNGTKAAFESKASQYADAIVFISGGTDSKGSCIYAQGMYFGNFAEFLSAINYVKGINVGGQSYNAAAGGGYVAFSATDPSTVAVNAGQNGVQIGLTTNFVNKVNNTASDLGNTGDAASSTGSAFARIANLAAIVGQLTGSEGGELESVEGQITNAINALRAEILGDLEVDDVETIKDINLELDELYRQIETINNAGYIKIGDVQAEIGKLGGSASDTKNGLVDVTVTTKGGQVESVEVGVTGLDTALAGKANLDESGKILASELPDYILGQVMFGGLIDANNSVIPTGNFSEKYNLSGSSITIKIDDYHKYEGVYFITTADGTILGQNVQVGDWIISSGSNWEKIDNTDAVASVAGLTGAITASALAKALAETGDANELALKSEVDAVEVTASGDNTLITASVSNKRAVSVAPTAKLTEAVAKAETAYQKAGFGIPKADLVFSVQTSLEKADSAYQKPSDGIPKTDLASAVQTSLGKADAAAPQATTYTKAEVDAMWEWEVIS